MKLPEVGWPVFLSDGGDAFGAIRAVGFRGRPDVLVYVENGGDFVVPFTAIGKVASNKVILQADRLSRAMHEAIAHATDVEDFPPEGEEEVELVPAPAEEDDPQDDSHAPSWTF